MPQTLTGTALVAWADAVPHFTFCGPGDNLGDSIQGATLVGGGKVQGSPADSEARTGIQILLRCFITCRTSCSLHNLSEL